MVTTAVQKMIDYVTEECQAVDLEQNYIDMLNECYSFDSVGGPFKGMQPADVLKEVDPTAYRCGFADYEREDTYEIDAETYLISDVDAARDEYIETLENEISALEDDADETDEEGDPTEDAEDAQDQIEALQADIAECQRYTF